MSREYKINNDKIEFIETNAVSRETSIGDLEKRIARFSNLIDIGEKELKKLKSEYNKLKAELPEVIELEEALKFKKELERKEELKSSDNA